MGFFIGGLTITGATPISLDGFIRENPVKMDDLGVPLFQETPNFVVIAIS